MQTLLKTLPLLLIQWLLITPSLQAAIVTHSLGNTESGRLGDIVGSEIQFQGERYYILDAQNVRAIEVDTTLTGDDLAQDEAKVARVNLLIDKRKYTVYALHNEARQQLRNAEYDRLEATAGTLTRNLERWEDGSWPIDDFFYSFTDDLGKRGVAGANRRLEQVEAWVSARPESGAAKLALAQVLIHKAWTHRGSGYSSTVTSDNMALFRENLERALQIVESASKAGYESPVLYKKTIWIMNALGADKDTLKDLARHSLTRYPEFYPTLITTYTTLLPRWSGKPGELQAFMEEVSADIRDTHPEVIFLAHRRFYSTLKARRYADMNFDWDSIQLGFEHYREQYHVNDEDLHIMARLACLHGDRDAAREYFDASLGNWNYLTKAVWHKKERLEGYRHWLEQEEPPYYQSFSQAVNQGDTASLNRMLRNDPELIDIFQYRNLYGDTLLHRVVERNDREMLLALAEFEVDLESRNQSGLTPLVWAAKQGRNGMVNTLLELGADSRSRRNYRGDQAAHLAAINGYLSTLKILVKHDQGAINSANNNQTRPLHLAAWNGHFDTVAYILRLRPNEIDRQDKYRYTPLHYAVDRGYEKIVRYLVEQGADTSLKNNKGHTPMSFARAQKFNDIESFLRSAGADDSTVADAADQRRRAEQVYSQSGQYFNQQDYKKAIEIYRESLEIDPTYSPGYAGLAAVAFNFEKDFEKADQYYDEAILRNPKNPENYYWKARTNYALNRPEVYRPLFIQYVEMAPDSYNAIDLQKNWSHLLEPYESAEGQSESSSNSDTASSSRSGSPIPGKLQNLDHFLYIAAGMLILIIVGMAVFKGRQTD